MSHFLAVIPLHRGCLDAGNDEQEGAQGVRWVRVRLGPGFQYLITFPELLWRGPVAAQVAILVHFDSVITPGEVLPGGVYDGRRQLCHGHGRGYQQSHQSYYVALAHD